MRPPDLQGPAPGLTVSEPRFLTAINYLGRLAECGLQATNHRILFAAPVPDNDSKMVRIDVRRGTELLA